MTSPVFVRTFRAPPLDRAQILRYAGLRGRDDSVEALLDECLDELLGALDYRVCYRTCSVTLQEDAVHFDGFCASSRDLAGLLSDSREALFFAATVGLAPDRLIQKHLAVSPTRALLVQAIGAERIEALLDAFVAERVREGMDLTRRFSAGYGDLPLSFQRQLFSFLDCPRQIGLTLNESLIMTPTKSVTALCGVR